MGDIFAAVELTYSALNETFHFSPPPLSNPWVLSQSAHDMSTTSFIREIYSPSWTVTAEYFPSH